MTRPSVRGTGRPSSHAKLHESDSAHRLPGSGRDRARIYWRCARPASARCQQPTGYLTYSWKQYRQAVEEIAAGLRSLGIGKGDIVALNSETRLRILPGRSGHHGQRLHRRRPVSQLSAAGPGPHHRPRCCAAVFVEDPKTLKGAAGGSGAPLDSAHRRSGGRPHAGRPARRAATPWPRDPQLLPRMRAEVQPSDYAILYLTSGATGEPKMALVTHQAIVSNLDMGPTCPADWAGGFHRGVSALGAHRAARGDRVAAASAAACR